MKWKRRRAADGGERFVVAMRLRALREGALMRRFGVWLERLAWYWFDMACGLAERAVDRILRESDRNHPRNEGR